jgi:uncharacterized protein YyaL (SSP411 family)
LRLFAARLREIPQAMPHMLLALDFSLEEPRRVVIAGDANAVETRDLIQAAQAVYQPGKVVLGTLGPVEPLARTLPTKDGRPTAYLCTGTACQPPTHDATQLKAMLK